MAAYDSGNPEERVYTEMMIYITRNEFGPVFPLKQYGKDILANIGLGTEVVKVTASDRDQVRILYQCLVYYKCQNSLVSAK